MMAPTCERARRYSQLEPRTGNLITPDVGLTRPSNIRNVVVAAAFAAAAAESSISMQDLILATARELHKIGRLPSRTEFREHYEAIREASA